MKRLGWGALAVLGLILLPTDAFSLATTPSELNSHKVNGPFLITGYSFSGHSLRYLQIYNASDTPVALEGWQVGARTSDNDYLYGTLAGMVAPKRYVTLANRAVVPTATFTFDDDVLPSDPLLTGISLIAPLGSGFNDEVASVTVGSSTERQAGTPPIFFFTRNVSAATGNYLSTFKAFLPSVEYQLASDLLYEVPPTAPLRVVEIFSNSPTCSPFGDERVCFDYVKLQNTSPQMIDLSTFRLRTGSYGQSATSSNTAALKGIVAPSEYTTVPVTLSSSDSWVWLEDTYGLHRYDESLTSYPSSSSHTDKAWSYDDSDSSWKWTPLLTPANTANRFPSVEDINICQGIIISEIGANLPTSHQFIEVFNTSSMAVSLRGCALQTNRSSTKTFTFNDEVLAPSSYHTVYVQDAGLTLTKTTQGTVYLLSSDYSTEVDQQTYTNLAEGSSWALVAGAWQQTYTPTPNAQNEWLEYLPCDEGYQRNSSTGRCSKTATNASLAPCGEGKYRHPTTNRCRNIEGSTSTLTPCGSNQVRNPTTNRCRSAQSSVASLKPCQTGQYRSLTTNRCRSLATAQKAALKPCGSNQERNPVTNRCRQKISAVAADFPVETVVQTAEATMGWWAFGGVGILAAGYAGWEWRREVGGLIRRLGSFVVSGR